MSNSDLLERLENMRLTEEQPAMAEFWAEIIAAFREERAERELLQDILDSRPAINAGLPETFIRWSQSIYSGEAYRAIEQSRTDHDLK